MQKQDKQNTTDTQDKTQDKMKKLAMRTPDMTQQNIDKLLELFPNCKTEKLSDKSQLEVGIDFDLLKQELSKKIVDGPKERYQLNWPGKKQALLTANAPISKTLRPCREESVNFDSTENLFIEGDNLDALKLLQETYLGKVKMIYIDPPYNTGKDFIYADNFAESTDEYLQESGQKDEDGNRLVANTDSNGRFHSDWLSMMYSRLKLSRNLLKDDGVIFISIDDNEQENLKKLCNEIFGEENFVGNIIWERAYAPINLKHHFSENHDYMLCYSKNISKLEKFYLTRSKEADAKYKNPDNDPRGVWKSSDFSVGPANPKNIYEIINPSGRKVLPPEGRSWVFSEDKLRELITDNRVWFGLDGKNVPSYKRFLSEVKNGVTPMTIWKYKEVGHSQDATKEVKNLFDGASFFSYPKPVTLINRCLDLCTRNHDVILDFFAGSGTTAHSVMNLNAEDDGQRKCISVQLPEACNEKSEAFKAGYATIAEISKERIRRAGKKIKKDNPDATDLDIGFRVLKIDSSNMKDVYYTPDETKQDELGFRVDHIKADRSGEDLLFQVMLDWGVDLSLPIRCEVIEGKTVYIVNDDDLIACFEQDINEALIHALAALSPLRAVFRDDCFGKGSSKKGSNTKETGDSTKINVEQIFKQLSPTTDIKAI